MPAFLARTDKRTLVPESMAAAADAPKRSRQLDPDVGSTRAVLSSKPSGLSSVNPCPDKTAASVIATTEDDWSAGATGRNTSRTTAPDNASLVAP